MNEKLFNIAVDAPIPTPLTYRAPLPLQNLTRGQSVIVPLGARSVNAVILGETQQRGDFELKTIQ